MNKKLCCIFISTLVTFFFGAGTAFGESESAHSLSRAVEQAAGNRLNVRLSDIDIVAARARVEQANSRFRPTLNIVSNLEKVHDYDTFSGTTASVTVPELNLQSVVDVESSTPEYSSSVDLSANYNVYSGGGDSANLKKSRLELKSAIVAREIEIQSVVQEVATAYFTVRRLCILSEGAARRLVSAQSKKATATDRLKLGRISDIEYRETILGLIESEADQRLRKDELNAALIDYMEVIGSSAGNYSTKEKACTFSEHVGSDLDYISSVSNKSLYKKYHELRWQAAQKQIDVVRANHRPKVRLYSSYSVVGRDNNEMLRSISDLHKDQWSVGVQIKYNLFDGGYTDRLVDESIAQAEHRRLQLEILNGNISRSLQRAEIGKRIAEDKVNLARARLELEQSRTTLLREKLKSGTTSTMSVNIQTGLEQDALETLQLAELDHALAMLEYFFPATTERININK